MAWRHTGSKVLMAGSFMRPSSSLVASSGLTSTVAKRCGMNSSTMSARSIGSGVWSCANTNNKRGFATDVPPPPPPPPEKEGKDQEEQKETAETETKQDENANGNNDDTKEENSPETKIKELEAKVEELESKVKEQKEDVLRSYAEMQNIKERTKREVQNASTYANQKFAKSLLDVADNLSRAIESVPAECPEEEAPQHLKTLHEGISMTETLLFKVFDGQGIKSFGEAGEKFDPNKHEAMFNIPDPSQEPNTVGQVVQKGYILKDRVLRSAQVGIVVKS